MQTYRLTVQYDGTDYAGFQVQPGQRTIQGELEKALARLAPNPIRISAAGRTDAGVHSEGQTVSFRDAGLTVPIERLAYALNALLPAEIRVIASRFEGADFHAQHSALCKTYRYQIYEDNFANVFLRRYALLAKHPLNWPRMEQCTRLFVGQVDFAAFAASGSKVKSTIRNMSEIQIATGDYLKFIRFTAEGFLYNMVRNLVGTLLLVGQGKMELADVERIIRSRDRRLAGPTAPAHGLVLESVKYA